jgi:hypothetical protein
VGGNIYDEKMKDRGILLGKLETCWLQRRSMGISKGSKDMIGLMKNVNTSSGREKWDQRKNDAEKNLTNYE